MRSLSQATTKFHVVKRKKKSAKIKLVEVKHRSAVFRLSTLTAVVFVIKA